VGIVSGIVRGVVVYNARAFRRGIYKVFSTGTVQVTMENI